MTVQQHLDEADTALRGGRIASAEQHYLQALRLDAANFTANNMLGVILAQQGRSGEALALFAKALKAQPRSPDALANHSRVLQMEGRFDEALAGYEKALAAAPNSATAWSNHGNALYHLNRHQEALASYDKALAFSPGYADAHYNRGLVLQALRRWQEALESYDRALAARPSFLEALNNRSIILLELERPQDALESSDRALKINPQHLEAWVSRGNALQKLNRFVESIASYDRVVALRPNSSSAWNNRGNSLMNLKRFDEAVASFDRALAIAPDNVEAWNNKGNVFKELRHADEAIACYDRALTLDPNFVAALHSRSTIEWVDKGRHDNAIRDAEKAFALDPDHPYGEGTLLHLRMHGADWRHFDRDVASVDAGVRAGRRVVEPFVYQGLSRSPQDLQTCAEIFARDRYPAASPMWPNVKRNHEKIRIGYVSGEFREQATAILMAGLYECHDKSEFEIIAFDNGYDDTSAMRRRLEAAFDKIVDIARLPDQAAAQKIAAEEIDILVNLNGYFGLWRMGIFARKPAPLQVNYLGFPGTLGADYMDYIVADRIVLPEDEQRFFTEKVAWLPDSYQVNDAWRAIAPDRQSRAEAGLPEQGFIFCNFNQSYKLTPELFAVWMRLLRDVEGSVLWLLDSNPSFSANLRREAERQGVAGDRLIFAPAMQHDRHLARIGLADLFLDELPYNAHTTASDALWAGLPLVTCRGDAFAGRVATSLLHALGLPELVTEDLGSYETLARELARDPARLKAIREKLSAQRHTAPLFDTARYCRHLEAAYRAMWQRHQRGEAPASFSV